MGSEVFFSLGAEPPQTADATGSRRSFVLPVVKFCIHTTSCMGEAFFVVVDVVVVGFGFCCMKVRLPLINGMPIYDKVFTM